MLTEKAKQGPTWLRAGVSAIPWAGGALDHLLFDRAGEIRMKNVEQSLEAMKETLGQMEEQKVSKEWFESEEALDMFKHLLNKIEFECDKAKIKTLSSVYCLFGTNEHKNDPNKNAVLETLSKLTTKQQIIFKAAGKDQPQQKTSNGEAISYTATAIWLSDLLEYVKANTAIMIQFFLQGGGTVYLNVELDFLVSLNLLRLQEIPNMKDTGYSFTSLGKQALAYLDEVKEN